MNPRSRTAIACVALLLCAGLTDAIQASPWSKVKAPSTGPAEVIGGTSNGCIGGALSLPAEGDGYVNIRRYRNRYYGHPELLQLIADLGRTQARRGEDLVMVGDLSQPRGGRMSSSHRSHQNGLDVDIWFRLAPSSGAANRDTAGKTDPPSMVSTDGENLSPLWGEDQRTLIKTAAEDPRVDRIFVNPAIKRGLCRSERDRTWLNKLRPWYGHDAHFHIRLKCPPGAVQCDQQAAIPRGDGCNKSLDWWFSAEARKPTKRSGPRAKPVMPSACRALLSSG